MALSVAPPTILIGLVGNTLTVMFIRKATGTSSSRITRFYIAIAVCDIGGLIFRYALGDLVNLIHYAIPWVPDGIQLPGPANLPVQALVMFVAAFSQMLGFYLRALLTAQRAFVITFPLSASCVTGKLMIILVTVIIGFCLLVSATPESIYGYAISIMSDNAAAYMYAMDIVILSMSFQDILIQFVPVAITAVSVCVMFVSLRRHLRQRRIIVADAASRQRSIFSCTEMKNTTAIMLIGVIDSVIAGYFALTKTLDDIGVSLYTLLGINTETLGCSSLALSYIGDVLNTFVFCDNFFVYLYCYKSFRESIVTAMKDMKVNLCN